MVLQPYSVKKGFILAVSAPSGTGKTSLCDKLAAELGFVDRSISVTTRAQRDGETNKVDYEFVTSEEFRRREEAGDFLETATVFKNLYGTPRKPVEDAIANGRVMVMDIDTVGALRIKELRPEDTVLLFIVPPSLHELEKRLRARGKNLPEDLAERLKMAALEIREASKYDYIINNEQFEEAYTHLKGVVLAERLKTRRLGPII